MAKDTNINWTDSTFNPWIGCTKIGPGCDNCYAKADFEDRRHRVVWGAGNPRSRTKTWGDPVRWNSQHAAFFAKHGRRQRVFCSSLADVFDNEVPNEWRSDLWALIRATSNLDWLLVTKRIGNAESMLPDDFSAERYPHVWLGITVTSQNEADRDIPKLLGINAGIKFLSMEPLLGPVDLSKWIDPWTCSLCGYHGSEDDSGSCRCEDCDVESKYDDTLGSDKCPSCGKDDGTSDEVGRSCPNCESVSGWSRDYGFMFDSKKPALLDWVIVGGESGPNARPMHPIWVDSIREQCVSAGVPFLFKQWGEWVPESTLDPANNPLDSISVGNACYHVFDGGIKSLRVGKDRAGRLLDGRVWAEWPDYLIKEG